MTEKLLFIACLTGFIGDGLLQLLVSQNVGDWGLGSYFSQHGRFESMFIAAGMMTLFYGIYIALKLPLKLEYLALYGIILDLIFRLTGLFPSLKSYYKHLNYFWSGIWGIIPMIIPLLIYKSI
jgi:hypothetical protein